MASEKTSSSKNLLMIVIIAIVVGAAGFFGGMQYQKMQRPSFAGASGAAGGFGRQGGFGGGPGRFGNGANRPVMGQIVSVDSNGITVKMQDGSTKIVVLSSSTMINKTADASRSDLTAGTTVAVFGTTNSDGSVTAQNVAINPQMRIARPSGAPSQAPKQSY